MANFRALGPLRIVTPGVPQQIVIPADQVPSCHRLIVQTLTANTGRIWIGDRQSMNKTTFVGIVYILAIPTANAVNVFDASIANGANAIPLNDLWFDADNANEGVSVSIIEA